MDTGETILVQIPFILEFATTSAKDAIVTTSTLGQSAPSKLRSQSSESVISPIFSQRETLKAMPVTRANAQPETYIINQSSYKVGRTETVTRPLCAESLAIIKDNFGFGFVVNWLVSWLRGERSLTL